MGIWFRPKEQTHQMGGTVRAENGNGALKEAFYGLIPKGKGAAGVEPEAISANAAQSFRGVGIAVCAVGSVATEIYLRPCWGNSLVFTEGRRKPMGRPRTRTRSINASRCMGRAPSSHAPYMPSAVLARRSAGLPVGRAILLQYIYW